MGTGMPHAVVTDATADMVATVTCDAVDSDDSEAEDPDRLRKIVARERSKLAAIAAAAEMSEATARRQTNVQDEVSREVARLDLSTEDLQEMVDLNSDFAWQRPLSRAAVIAYLSSQPDQAVTQSAVQLCEPNLEQQFDVQQQGESSGIGPVAQSFPLQTAAGPTRHGCFEAFAIDSDESDDCEAPSVASDADADDGYWLSEFGSRGTGGTQPAADEQEGSLSDDGGRPAKRHRPG